MSHHGSLEHAPGEPAEALEVIKEEFTPVNSAIKIDVPPENPVQGTLFYCCKGCKCVEEIKPCMDLEDVQKLLKQKEDELTSEYNERIKREIDMLKDRADFILENEQVRASYMLREAHRERQEKISALQTQLECKNLAGLMYVMCSERKRSKLEKLKMEEEYTNYILSLHDILTEAQSLILNLSRGYKTAAKVDNEWRDKMKKTLKEFQMFIHNHVKGTPESDQYFFDLPKLLKTEAPIVDNPNEDPCNCEDEEESVNGSEIDPEEQKNPWYERLEAECRPFVMFGDMAEFKPPQRREVLRAQKRVKSAPRKWKEYVFHDMFVNSKCSNANAIKEVYPEPAPLSEHWECPVQSSVEQQKQAAMNSNELSRRRTTTASIDARGTMGSIIKMITSSNSARHPAKPLLLGARDSMEIVSATRLREKHKQAEAANVILNVGARRTSLFDYDLADDESTASAAAFPEPESSDVKVEEEDDNMKSDSLLGSIHNDSLTRLPHRPDRDHKIHHEKVCPVEKCRRLQVDSFLRTLPAYMRASPFTYFEQSYDQYETCSPEQLEILRQRIDKKKKGEKTTTEVPEAELLAEWTPSVEGTAVQTSEISMSLPPCTCRGPNPSPISSKDHIFNLEDLVPMKKVLNQINHECFYDSTIQFNRFKVIGQESCETIKRREDQQAQKLGKKPNRLAEVTKVLKQHPSLLDIFQANTA